MARVFGIFILNLM